MSHHQFGELVGDVETGGIIGGYVMLDDYASVSIETIRPGQQLPVLALSLNGRVSRTNDTHAAVYLMSLLDAGALVRFIYDAVKRIDDPTAAADFRVGMATGNDATGVQE